MKRLVLLGAVVLLQACPDDPRQVGESCLTQSECATGLLCVETCLAPDGDVDGDGLTNQVEADDPYLDPLNDDTDGDGDLDGQEVSTVPFTDTDGDGVHDAYESSVGDADGDCVADEFDSSLDTRSPQEVNNCLLEGVCTEASVDVDCTAEDKCVYTATNFELDEVSCDNVDNDCDGEVDEHPDCSQPPGDCMVADAPCDDGDGCTVNDTCDGAGTCLPGERVDFFEYVHDVDDTEFIVAIQDSNGFWVGGTRANTPRYTFIDTAGTVVVDEDVVIPGNPSGRTVAVYSVNGPRFGIALTPDPQLPFGAAAALVDVSSSDGSVLDTLIIGGPGVPTHLRAYVRRDSTDYLAGSTGLPGTLRGWATRVEGLQAGPIYTTDLPGQSQFEDFDDAQGFDEALLVGWWTPPGSTTRYPLIERIDKATMTFVSRTILDVPGTVLDLLTPSSSGAQPMLVDSGGDLPDRLVLVDSSAELLSVGPLTVPYPHTANDLSYISSDGDVIIGGGAPGQGAPAWWARVERFGNDLAYREFTPAGSTEGLVLDSRYAASAPRVRTSGYVLEGGVKRALLAIHGAWGDQDCSTAGACIADDECDDGDPCTEDRCEPGGGCTFVPRADGARCGSGDLATCEGHGTCQAGVCAYAPALFTLSGALAGVDSWAPAGAFRSSSGDLVVFGAGAQGASGVGVVARYDSSGSLLGSTPVGLTTDIVALDVGIERSDGSILLVGRTSGPDLWVTASVPADGSGPTTELRLGTATPKGLFKPDGEEGHLFVADEGVGPLQVYRVLEGQVAAEPVDTIDLGVPLATELAVAWDEARQRLLLVVGTNGRIIVAQWFPATGRLVQTHLDTAFQTPTAVVPAPDGGVYAMGAAAAGACVATLMAPDGARVWSYSLPGSGCEPRAAVASPGGLVMVASEGASGRFVRLDTAGRLLVDQALQADPRAINPLPEGHLLMAGGAPGDVWLARADGWGNTDCATSGACSAVSVDDCAAQLGPCSLPTCDPSAGCLASSVPPVLCDPGNGCARTGLCNGALCEPQSPRLEVRSNPVQLPRVIPSSNGGWLLGGASVRHLSLGGLVTKIFSGYWDTGANTTNALVELDPFTAIVATQAPDEGWWIASLTDGTANAGGVGWAEPPVAGGGFWAVSVAEASTPGKPVVVAAMTLDVTGSNHVVQYQRVDAAGPDASPQVTGSWGIGYRLKGVAFEGTADVLGFAVESDTEVEQLHFAQLDGSAAPAPVTLNGDQLLDVVGSSDLSGTSGFAVSGELSSGAWIQAVDLQGNTLWQFLQGSGSSQVQALAVQPGTGAVVAAGQQDGNLATLWVLDKDTGDVLHSTTGGATLGWRDVAVAPNGDIAATDIPGSMIITNAWLQSSCADAGLCAPLGAGDCPDDPGQSCPSATCDPNVGCSVLTCP